MGYTTSATLPATDGTSALRVCPRRLVVLEGGLREAGCERHAEPRRGELSASQGLGLIACGAAVILAVLLASAVSGPLRSARAREAIDALPTQSVVVASGDSLWQIAERCGDVAPTRDVVSWIQERNGIDGGLVEPGQTLVVPAAPAEG